MRPCCRSKTQLNERENPLEVKTTWTSSLGGGRGCEGGKKKGQADIFLQDPIKKRDS